MRASCVTTTGASVSSGSRRRRARRWTRRRWTIVDLETTGVGASARIVEIGAVRLEGDRQVGTISRLVDPGIPMPPRITQITGIRDRDLAGAGPLRPAIAELLALARGSIFVAHNASFDVGMLDRALMRLDGTRVGMRVLDTVALARRLLAGRLARFDLASVSERFDVTVRPCHRALPDALATAEVLVALIGLAQERGAETAEDVMALALAPPRRARQQRHLATGLPAGPGVYVMRDRLGQALYVGKAGDLRTPRALVLRPAQAAAAHRGRARGAREDRLGAARGRSSRRRSASSI